VVHCHPSPFLAGLLLPATVQKPRTRLQRDCGIINNVKQILPCQCDVRGRDTRRPQLAYSDVGGSGLVFRRPTAGAYATKKNPLRAAGKKHSRRAGPDDRPRLRWPRHHLYARFQQSSIVSSKIGQLGSYLTTHQVMSCPKRPLPCVNGPGYKVQWFLPRSVQGNQPTAGMAAHPPGYPGCWPNSRREKTYIR